MSTRTAITSGRMTFLQAEHPQSAWEAAARDLLDEGQVLLAYDLAQRGLGHYPGSRGLRHVTALALIRTGAFPEACALLEAMVNPYRPDEKALAGLRGALARSGPLLLPGPDRAPDAAELDALSALFRHLGQAVQALAGSPHPDGETLSLLARTYKDLWRSTGDRRHARRARDLYLRAFEEDGGYYPAVNAATMSALLGEREAAAALSRQALAACAAAEGPDRRGATFYSTVTRGEAHLHLGEEEQARACYAAALLLPGVRPAQLVSARQQLLLLSDHGVAVPAALLSLLHPPGLLLFTGHMIDAPGRTPPRFPPEREGEVRAEIERHLDQLDARIGYSSAACGADLLFIEAMLDRDAEVNVVLPFAEADFIRTSVEHAGARWVSRFRRALRQARTVVHVTEEPYLGSSVLFALCNHVIRGLCELRAAALFAEPTLLAVYDGRPGGPGGTADVVAGWRDPSRVRVVPLGGDGAAAGAGAPGPGGPPLRYLRAREVQCLLFADVVGFSGLSEEGVQQFTDVFLARLAAGLKERRGAGPGATVNTWGDGIFAVMADPVDMIQYALALQGLVRDTDWIAAGLPVQLNLRIGVHAGPVFAGIDPLTGRQNYYGAHVNRAARIEPVTTTGCIYASEQFVAYLISRLLETGRVTRRPDRPLDLPYRCEYLGTRELAKGFGSQALYHVHV